MTADSLSQRNMEGVFEDISDFRSGLFLGAALFQRGAVLHALTIDVVLQGAGDELLPVAAVEGTLLDVVVGAAFYLQLREEHYLLSVRPQHIVLEVVGLIDDDLGFRSQSEGQQLYPSL